MSRTFRFAMLAFLLVLSMAASPAPSAQLAVQLAPSPLDVHLVGDPIAEYDARILDEAVAIVHREGRAGEVIAERQERLAELGWYQGPVDGILGPLTDSAREEFERAAGVSRASLADALFADDAPRAPEPEPEPEPKPAPEPESHSPDPAPAATSGVPWDAIARCESGYGGEPNWSINTGNGYYGGLQFDKSSWDWAGGQRYAEWPHEASREQQIATAERLLSMHPAGLGAWPACTSKLGLR